MENFENKELKLAQEFVLYTHKNIFLTGKAGTGKTTFLKNLKLYCPKRMVVVAPTGVAAINAGGVTIHSFFQLPFSPFISAYTTISENSKNEQTDNSAYTYKLSRNKIKLIQSLDLLVIDEISMVRADLLDAVDDVLRKYRHTDKPFGGVQLLMIGDLHQLAPVVKEDEWNILRDFYDSAFFFSSKALQKTELVTIELKHIYRQSDETFISLLGEIRENKVSQKSIELLNSRYEPDFNLNENEGYITLTTHNANAQEINDEKLKKIKLRSKKFKAKIKDDFPEYMYPTEYELELKVGAQVMFVKNDSSFEKLYYNGKIGIITKFVEDLIVVKCDNQDEIYVKTEMWENVRYTLNNETKEIDEEVIGSFEQYPLKLAWAITVHKSQGLTFEKAIIDVNAAFAFGQVYVALSRCKSLEGLVLISKIPSSAIKTDSTISRFNENAAENAPDQEKLQDSKLIYQQNLILEQFDFLNLKKRYFSVKKIYTENILRFGEGFVKIFEEITAQAQSEIFDVNDKFIKQLNYLFNTNKEELPENSEQILDRIAKASKYYIEKFNFIFISKFKSLYFDCDNKEISNEMDNAINRFELELKLKLGAMQASVEKFETLKYLRALSDTEVDFKSEFNRPTVYSSHTENKNLFAELNAWRKSLAEDSGIDVYKILPYKTLRELVEKLPQNLTELGKIKGIGKVKLKQFGDDILDIIYEYCERNNIKRAEPVEEIISKTKAKKKQAEKLIKEPKKDTKTISFELFKQGKSIEEIAEERSLVFSTIFGHLSHFVLKGELEITELVEQVRLDKIVNFIEEQENLNLRDLVEKSNYEFNYNELKLIIACKEKFE